MAQLDSCAPLSQQVCAWILQATGTEARERDATGRTISRSSVKNALRGVPLSAAWERLVDAFAEALGMSLDDAQRQALFGTLRAWDEHARKLDSYGLPLSARVRALSRWPAREIGMRLGALARYVEVSSRADDTCSDAICDSFAPDAFGRIVHCLFQIHFPDRKKRDERYALLREHGVHPRTDERWHGGEIDAPNAKSVEKLADAFDPRDRRRARTALLAVRVAARLRKDLARWGSPEVADEFAREVLAWATTTREALRKPGIMADLDALTPHREDVDRARWMLMRQILEPHPLLFGVVAGALGVDGPALLGLHPLVVVQAEWMVLALASEVSGAAEPGG